MEPQVQPRLELSPAPPGKTTDHGLRSGAVPTGLIFLLVVLNALVLIRIWQSDPAPKSMPVIDTVGASSATGGGNEQLALLFEDRSLWNSAAEEWLALAQKSTDPELRAKAYYRSGILYQKGNRHEQAAAALLAAEAWCVKATDTDLKAQIGIKLLDSLRALGRSGEISRELARRADKGLSSAGEAQILAYIDGDPITEADLDRMVEHRMDLLSGMHGSLDPKAREQFLQQMRTPEMREKLLKELLNQEVLVRRALDLKLDHDPTYREMQRFGEQRMLAELLLRKEIHEKLNPTQEDLKNYYTANLEKYISPPTAQLRIIEVPSREAATELSTKLKDADEQRFEMAAREHSIHSSKTQGGLISAPFVAGRPFADLGFSKPLEQAIFEAPLTKTSQPLEVERRHLVLFVKSREAQSQQNFEEVKEQVAEAYARSKTQALTEQLQQDLQARYKVRFNTQPKTRTTPANN